MSQLFHFSIHSRTQILLLIFGIFYATFSLAESTCKPIPDNIALWRCEFQSRISKTPVQVFLHQPYVWKKTNVVFHLNGMHTTDARLEEFSFDRQIASVDQNVAVIVPMWKKVKKFIPFSNSREKLLALLEEVRREIEPTIAHFEFNPQIILSAHSAGYRLAANILKHSAEVFAPMITANSPYRVRSLALFDAIYRYEEYSTFLTLSKQLPLFSIYQDKSETLPFQFNKALMYALPENRYISTSTNEIHSATDTPRNTSTLFLSTTEDHFTLLRNWYGNAIDWLLRLRD